MDGQGAEPHYIGQMILCLRSLRSLSGGGTLTDVQAVMLQTTDTANVRTVKNWLNFFADPEVALAEYNAETNRWTAKGRV